ncbi:uncharacterized protein TNCV_3644101 [Trichonephila clavipes]|nr:uncharacterized protein TNCV_3644101 [Trichonephila clavipes]
MFSWCPQLCEDRIQASPVPACGINEDLFACVRSAVFPDFQVSSARIPECSCVVLYKFEEVAKELEVEVVITLPKMEFKKRICQSKYYTEEVDKCLLEGILEEKREEREKRERNRATEVSEPVNKCRPLINPVDNKSVENAASCDFENENCDPPVRWANVPPRLKSTDCEVKVKAGLCEGSVKAVAMGAQRVINPDNIGVDSFELKGDKGVANSEGLICENICEENIHLGR